jgi:hypothetical protein
MEKSKVKLDKIDIELYIAYLGTLNRRVVYGFTDPVAPRGR